MKKPILISLLILLALGLLAGGVVLASRWNKPLAESISMASPTSDEAVNTPSADTPEPTQLPEITNQPDEVTSEPTQKATPTTKPSPTPKQPVCGGPELMYILAVGVGNDTYTYGLADLIRLVRVDFVTPKVTVMTIPRDLWVEIPDIVESKRELVPMQKINTAYLYGVPDMGYYEGPAGGPGLLARTIAHNYDLYVDNYAAVNMVAFEEIIDAMGGVDIYLEQAVDGRPKGNDEHVGQGYFYQGWNHLTGFDALSFVRIRDRYTEVIRTEHQTLVMCAIMEKLNRPDILKSVPKMIFSVLDDIQTDLTISQITQLLCLLPKLNGNIEFVRFPDEWMVQGYEYDARAGGNTFVWKIPIENIIAYLDEFEADTLKPSEEAATSCPVNPPRE